MLEKACVSEQHVSVAYLILSYIKNLLHYNMVYSLIKQINSDGKKACYDLTR